MGNQAGYQATSANNSNFFGIGGRQASSASNSNSLVIMLGGGATFANRSNFIWSKCW
jgi:hypothetical protein